MVQQNTSKIIRSVNASKYNFTPISNNLIQNTNISLEARGLVSFIISLPEYWIIYKGQVQKALKMGDLKFDRIWKECVEAGYISVKKQRLSNGRWKYDYTITDIASVSETTTGGKVRGGKPTSIIKKEKEKINKENNIQESNSNIPGNSVSSFADIFNPNISQEDILNYIRN
jgi:hypothetical protein